MIAGTETYGGIDYVRISSLPEDQKRLASREHLGVIKIQRGKELLSDCVPYRSYAEWYHRNFGHDGVGRH